jgi:hypothetical protein
MSDSREKEWHGRGSPQYDESIHIPLLHKIIGIGEGIAAFCAEANICDESFHAWRHKHPEFKKQYEIALAKGAAIWENKPLSLAERGISLNHNYWATIMRMRYKYYKGNLKPAKENTTQSRLEAAHESLQEGTITTQEYTQITSGIAAESKIAELELQKQALEQAKNQSKPVQLSDEAVRAAMLVQSGKGKVVEIGDNE